MMKKMKKYLSLVIVIAVLGLCMPSPVIFGGECQSGSFVVENSKESSQSEETPSESQEVLATESTPSQEPTLEATILPSMMPSAVPSLEPTQTESAAPSASPQNTYKLTFAEQKIVLSVGETKKCYVKVSPEKYVGTITWESKNPSVVSVEANGTVTAKAKGNTQIVAKPGESTAVCDVTVVGKKAISLSLDRKSVVINGSEQVKLSAKVYPIDAETRITWQSSNSYIADVDSYGCVYGKFDGSCKIVVKTEDGLLSAECTVVVKGNVVNYVTLDRITASLKVGETKKITATISPNTVRVKTVLWTSSNSEVASVDALGNVKALKPGTAIITATSVNNGKKATCNVTVTEPAATQLNLNKTSEEVAVGKECKLIPSVYPTTATMKDISWTSSNPSVASVDNNGVVKGIAYGKTVITATLSNLKAKCTISVDGTYGRKSYNGGGFYAGKLGNGKRNGRGILTRASGTKINGVWSNDKLISKVSTVKFPNGDKFVGCYFNYVKSGKGTYTKKDGTVIKGKWTKNKLTGKAVITYSDGDKFTGYFKNDKKNGTGTYKFANGDKYVGKWKNDKMNGQGKYTFKNGSYYKGKYKNNKLTGVGYFKEKGGKLYKGVFKNGKMIKVISVK